MTKHSNKNLSSGSCVRQDPNNKRDRVVVNNNNNNNNRRLVILGLWLELVFFLGRGAPAYGNYNMHRSSLIPSVTPARRPDH